MELVAYEVQMTPERSWQHLAHVTNVSALRLTHSASRHSLGHA